MNPHRDPTDGLVRRVAELEAELAQEKGRRLAAALELRAEQALSDRAPWYAWLARWSFHTLGGIVAAILAPKASWMVYPCASVLIVFGILLLLWFRGARAVQRLAIPCACPVCAQLRGLGFKKKDTVRVARVDHQSGTALSSPHGSITIGEKP